MGRFSDLDIDMQEVRARAAELSVSVYALPSHDEMYGVLGCGFGASWQHVWRPLMASAYLIRIASEFTQQVIA